MILIITSLQNSRFRWLLSPHAAGAGGEGRPPARRVRPETGQIDGQRWAVHIFAALPRGSGRSTWHRRRSTACKGDRSRRCLHGPAPMTVRSWCSHGWMGVTTRQRQAAMPISPKPVQPAIWQECVPRSYPLFGRGRDPVTCPKTKKVRKPHKGRGQCVPLRGRSEPMSFSNARPPFRHRL